MRNSDHPVSQTLGEVCRECLWEIHWEIAAVTLVTAVIMHPPLDRPHPDCRKQIDALRGCHASTSKLRFWACNENKFALDRCLREEKDRHLESMNKHFEIRRKSEDEAFMESAGKTESFEDFLSADPEYRRAKSSTDENRRKGRPDLYTRKAHGS